MTDLFQPFDLEQASAVRDVDDLPFGVIVVDRSGTILEYNTYETEMTGFSKERVLGRNFFHDVAPCTAIKEFEGSLRGVPDVARPRASNHSSSPFRSRRARSASASCSCA